MLSIRSPFTEGSPSDGRASHLRALRGPKWLLLAAVLLCPITPAKAEYRLQVGDVMEIAVARPPQLKQRVRIHMDGTITYPLLGTVSVADLSPAAMQAKVQATLAAKVFRQIAPDGRENSVAIDPDEVTASIAEYRPVYVNGDIARPGEQVYRPLMTVRQAIALSGGYDVIPSANEQFHPTRRGACHRRCRLSFRSSRSRKSRPACVIVHPEAAFAFSTSCS